VGTFKGYLSKKLAMEISGTICNVRLIQSSSVNFYQYLTVSSNSRHYISGENSQQIGKYESIGNEVAMNGKFSSVLHYDCSHLK
jgi:hypothetical protein